MTPPDEARVIAGTLRADGKTAWLTTAWDAFCDCDELPVGIDYQAYLDWLDDTPLVDFRFVNADDLEDPFAEDRGIRADGLIYCLTPLGLRVRAILTEEPHHAE